MRYVFYYTLRDDQGDEKRYSENYSAAEFKNEADLKACIKGFVRITHAEQIKLMRVYDWFDVDIAEITGKEHAVLIRNGIQTACWSREGKDDEYPDTYWLDFIIDKAYTAEDRGIDAIMQSIPNTIELGIY